MDGGMAYHGIVRKRETRIEETYMATNFTLNKDANITKSNSDINEEILFGAPSSGSFLMDVAVDGHAELIQELTDASRDKGAYAIREALSNAFDATLKAGHPSSPVTVRIPASVSRTGRNGTSTLADRLNFMKNANFYVSIEDRGVGMTADELRENFAQYGNSDKRGLGAIGSKGLGSKAPLACADFFEVSSTKGGITTRMLLWREDGGNYAKVISERRTNRHSGTIVRIPVSDEATRTQMEHQLVMIAGWNTQFNLVAYVGSRQVGNDPAKRLGTEVGHAYEAPLGYRSSGYSWSAPTLRVDNYLYMGRATIAKSSDGADVSVDVWRSLESIDGKVNDPEGFGDSASIDINLMGVRYPLLRNGAVGSSESMTDTAEYVIGCEPGYLNFTVSRDDIKEDDAWRMFVSSLRSGLAEFDQRPAVVAHLGQLRDIKERYLFMRRRQIELARNGQTYSLAGMELDDRMLGDLFSDTDPATGEVIDLAPLLAMNKGDATPGGIKVLLNDGGNMHGVTDKPQLTSHRRYGYGSRQSGAGYGYAGRYNLNPKDVRLAIAEATSRSDCAAILAAVGDKYYSSDSTCDNLDVVILTNMGEGCTRVATADKFIRKYRAAEKQRPQYVSMMYVLCEGDYEPSDAEQTILEWFKSWTISKFDDYVKECRSGITLREKAAREAREKAELKARMSRSFRVPVADASHIRARLSQKSVLDSIVMGEPRIAPMSYEYVNAYNMDEEDIMVILQDMSDWKRDGIAYAWGILEATGAVATKNGDKHRRLVVTSATTARDMGVYDMGDDRKFDILLDATGTIHGLMPDGIGFASDGTVTGTVSDFGITTKSNALTAALLRCDDKVRCQSVGGFYRIAGTTGNKTLDTVVSSGSHLDRWVAGASGSSYYAPRSERIPIRLVPSGAAERRYDKVSSTARRLTELWNKGIGTIADPALRRSNYRSLPGNMSYEVLQEAMAALV